MILALLASGAGGFFFHKKLSINYKQRWQEALSILKEEKIASKELLSLEEGGNWVQIPSQESFKKLYHYQRLDLEEDRLKKGLPPQDAFGGCDPEHWTKGRKMQLNYGWEYESRRGRNGYRKVTIA
jgi:hypothetical protein